MRRSREETIADARAKRLARAGVRSRAGLVVQLPLTVEQMKARDERAATRRAATQMEGG